MTSSIPARLVCLLAAIATLAIAPHTNAQAFQYQGRLSVDGVVVDGSVDVVVRLFDSETRGLQVGPTLSFDRLAVSDGLVSITLNFGPAFDCNPRWLEFEVDEVLLTPRQEILPTPYASYALQAPWATLTGVPAGFADDIDNDTQYTWASLPGIPAGFLDGVDNDTLYTWGTLPGIPAGFLDGIDNDTLPLWNSVAGGISYSIGDVGIGTSSPDWRLDVSGTTGTQRLVLPVFGLPPDSIAITSGFPGINFTPGWDTGIYSALGDSLSVAVNNAECARFGDAALTVFGDNNDDFGASYNLRDTGDNSNWQIIRTSSLTPLATTLQFRFDNGFGSPTTRLTLTEPGRLGVGTDSPDYRLDVNGTSRTERLLLPTGGTPDTPSIAFDPDDNSGVYSAANNTVSVAVAGRERARFSGASLVMYEDAADGFGAHYNLRDTDDDTNWQIIRNSSSATSPSLLRFRFDDGGGHTTRFTVTPDGDVGIGTTSPQSRLHVDGGEYGGLFRGDGVSSSPGSRYGLRGESTATTGMGAGVVGSASSTSGFDFYASGAGFDYGAASSQRWKRNIKSLEQPLEMLAQLRGVRFDWDEAHGGKHDVAED